MRAGFSECDSASIGRNSVPGTSSLTTGLMRGGRRVAIHMVKAGVEVLRGVEGFFEELASATRAESTDAVEKGPKRIPLD